MIFHSRTPGIGLRAVKVMSISRLLLKQEGFFLKATLSNITLEVIVLFFTYLNYIFRREVTFNLYHKPILTHIFISLHLISAKKRYPKKLT